MIRNFLLLFVAAGAAVAGCGASAPIVLDGGPLLDADAPQPVTRTLSFDSAGPIRLEPLARFTVGVTLRDDAGAPVAGTVIHLALTGDAQDAALDNSGPTTDANGHAQAMLQAPSSAATLNVRARADQAADLLLDVSVSDRGFGSLAVTPRYAGVRGPTNFTLQLFDGLACDALSGADPVRSGTLPATGGTVLFGSVAAGQAFTVRGLALGASGAIVGTGCVPGLAPARDDQFNVALPIDDLPLAASGAYALTVQYDLGALPTSAAAQWQAAVHAVRDASEFGAGDAAYLLGAIGGAISADPHASDRVAFDAAVHAHLLDDLSSDLLRRSASPTAALDNLATDTASVTAGTLGEVSLASMPQSDGTSTLTVTGVVFSVNPLTPDVTTDDLTLALAMAQVSGAGRLTPEHVDRFRVDLNAVSLPFTGVARRAADAMLARLGATDASEWAQLTARCTDVATVVHGSTGATCDDACVVAACTTAVARLGAAFDATLSTTDGDRVSVSFSFDAAAHGLPGSLRLSGGADPAALTGTFDGATPLPVQGVATLATAD